MGQRDWGSKTQGCKIGAGEGGGRRGEAVADIGTTVFLQ